GDGAHRHGRPDPAVGADQGGRGGGGREGRRAPKDAELRAYGRARGGGALPLPPSSRGGSGDRYGGGSRDRRSIRRDRGGDGRPDPGRLRPAGAADRGPRRPTG